MTIKELKEILTQYPDELEVMTKKNNICGNIGEIYNVNESSYGFFWKRNSLYYFRRLKYIIRKEYLVE